MLILDGILELFFRRLIVEIFGYYTLYAVFKIFRHKKGILWLNGLDEEDELDALGNGCVVSIAGFISFTLFVLLIAYSIDAIFPNAF
jgi:hypothetical protein